MKHLFIWNSLIKSAFPKRGISSAVSVLAIGMVFLLSSCTNQDEPTPVIPDEPFSTSILIYAVASNNLSPDFASDMNEVKMAAESMDLSKSDIWVYSVLPSMDPTLSHLVYNKENGYEFEVVKNYDRLVYSTDPKRISLVIDDYLKLSDSNQRGLVFWSHATGWSPNFSDHLLPQSESSEDETRSLESDPVSSSNGIQITGKVEEDPKGWYGQDIYNGKADYCDLLELDSAIPENTFDFIWFDCCYMSAIEVLYQLRDKTPYIVAYPTEVAGEGLPYQITLPFMAAPEIDLVEAAKATAKYFLDKNAVITICVTDTSALPALAMESSKAVGGERPRAGSLQRYSRYSNGPFYDFGQYTSEWGCSLDNGAWDEAAFRAALDKVVLYKAASETGFDRRPIIPECYSGISCHYYHEVDSEEARYYQQLDWFKVMYADFEED